MPRQRFSALQEKSYCFLFFCFFSPPLQERGVLKESIESEKENLRKESSDILCHWVTMQELAKG